MPTTLRGTQQSVITQNKPGLKNPQKAEIIALSKYISQGNGIYLLGSKNARITLKVFYDSVFIHSMDKTPLQIDVSTINKLEHLEIETPDSCELRGKCQTGSAVFKTDSLQQTGELVADKSLLLHVNNNTSIKGQLKTALLTSSCNELSIAESGKLDSAIAVVKNTKLSNKGILKATHTLVIGSDSFSNHANLSAKHLVAQVKNKLINNGHIYSKNKSQLQANEVTNHGQVNASGPLTIKAKRFQAGKQAKFNTTNQLILDCQEMILQGALKAYKLFIKGTKALLKHAVQARKISLEVDTLQVFASGVLETLEGPEAIGNNLLRVKQALKTESGSQLTLRQTKLELADAQLAGQSDIAGSEMTAGKIASSGVLKLSKSDLNCQNVKQTSGKIKLRDTSAHIENKIQQASGKVSAKHSFIKSQGGDYDDQLKLKNTGYTTNDIRVNGKTLLEESPTQIKGMLLIEKQGNMHVKKSKMNCEEGVLIDGRLNWQEGELESAWVSGDGRCSIYDNSNWKVSDTIWFSDQALTGIKHSHVDSKNLLFNGVFMGKRSRLNAEHVHHGKTSTVDDCQVDASELASFARASDATYSNSSNLTSKHGHVQGDVNFESAQAKFDGLTQQSAKVSVKGTHKKKACLKVNGMHSLDSNSALQLQDAEYEANSLHAESAVKSNRSKVTTHKKLSVNNDASFKNSTLKAGKVQLGPKSKTSISSDVATCFNAETLDVLGKLNLAGPVTAAIQKATTVHADAKAKLEKHAELHAAKMQNNGNTSASNAKIKAESLKQSGKLKASASEISVTKQISTCYGSKTTLDKKASAKAGSIKLSGNQVVQD